MKEFLNCYETLGIKNTASLREIKDAYREKCKENHPDKVGNTKEAHENMCKINEAYETLADTSLRGEHDYQLKQRIRREKDAQWDAERAAEKAEEEAKKNGQEAPKRETPVKPIFEWTEPAFKNTQTPDRSDYPNETLYRYAVADCYAKEDNYDYNNEETVEFLTFLDYYIQTYMEQLQMALYMKTIEVVLYNKLEEQFGLIYRYTEFYYEKNNNIRQRKR